MPLISQIAGKLASGYLDASPKSDMVLDLPCCFTWIRVVPGGILIDLIAYDNIVVAGFALPMTGRVSAAVSKVFRSDGAYWKVVVPFDNNCFLTLRQSCAVPYCFHKNLLVFDAAAALAERAEDRLDGFEFLAIEPRRVGQMQNRHS